MAEWWIVFGYVVAFEREILTFSPKALAGCIAHELAHIVLEKRRPFFRGLGSIGGIDRTGLERDTDLLVIERGMGEELFQFHKEHGKKYKAYKASECLTKHEVAKILKNRKNLSD